MKVILTGATGFIGGEVLRQILSNNLITSLICLTRRALPENVTTNPKVKVITISDFTSYPPEIIAQLEGSECCIWAMGSPAMKSTSVELSRMVEIVFTHAAANAFAEHLAPPLKAQGKKFRFVYLSGKFAERDMTKKLCYLKDTRKIKGEVENGLLALQQQENSNFELSILRPGGVMPKWDKIPGFVVSLTGAIKVDELASVMIDEAVGGIEGTRTLESDALRTRVTELATGGK